MKDLLENPDLPDFEAICIAVKTVSAGILNLPQAPPEAKFIGLLDDVDKAYLVVIESLKEKTKITTEETEKTGKLSEGSISSLLMIGRRIINLQEDLDCRIAMRFPEYRDARYLFTSMGVYVDPEWERCQDERLIEAILPTFFGGLSSMKPIVVHAGMSKEEMFAAGLTQEMMEKMPEEIKKKMGIE